MTSNRSSNITEKLEQDERRGRTNPLLLEFYKRLLQIQSEAGRAGIPRTNFNTEAINERLSKGSPILEFDKLVLDWRLVEETFAKVIATFADYPDLFGEIPEHALTKDMVRRWFEGSALTCPPASENVLGDMIHATLNPFLASYSKGLLGSVSQERWRRGYCPICGGNPDFALLKGESGARWLVCSRCDAEWLFQRLECPYCTNNDQDSLAYFTDDQGLYLLYICEKCKRYIKAIDTRKAKSEVIVPVERLFSMDIDRQGQEMGYSPCISPKESR